MQLQMFVESNPALGDTVGFYFLLYSLLDLGDWGFKPPLGLVKRVESALKCSVGASGVRPPTSCADPHLSLPHSSPSNIQILG